VITVATVKDHVHRVLRKSGLRTRAAIASEWQRAHAATLAP
jgi:DNA-binding CsgD family transcriptional regulator